MQAVTIAGRRIGPGEPAYLVAEAGVNHNGDVATAERMIEVAKEVGADAIKFQSFQAEAMCDTELTETKNVEGVTGGTKSSYEMYKSLELSRDAHARLFAKARAVGITLFASVFDFGMVEYLTELETPASKIASGDLTHLPLIRRAAAADRPLILSTGLSTMAEVTEAVACCRAAGNDQVILLQCTSTYPPADDEVNLNVVASLREAFDVPVGFSDHTLGIEIAIAAVTMGACLIEKHFTLDNAMPGPDQELSLGPGDFARLVSAVRRVELARGSARKEPTSQEQACLLDSRRSLCAAREIAAGEALAEELISILKPAKGIEPKFLDAVLGRRARSAIRRMEPIRWEDI